MYEIIGYMGWLKLKKGVLLELPENLGHYPVMPFTIYVLACG